LRRGERQQKHLTSEQQEDLRKELELHSALFNGILGLCPHRQVHLDFKPDAIPYHSRPYASPFIHHDIFKNELKRLCESDVLEHFGASEWATGTFIVPKKDKRFCWVSDLRGLNANLIRKKHPLPKIQDILNQTRNEYKFFTKLDISIQYYAFVLDDERKDLCNYSFRHVLLQATTDGCLQSSRFCSTNSGRAS